MKIGTKECLISHLANSDNLRVRKAALNATKSLVVSGFLSLSGKLLFNWLLCIACPSPSWHKSIKDVLSALPHFKPHVEWSWFFYIEFPVFFRFLILDFCLKFTLSCLFFNSKCIRFNFRLHHAQFGFSSVWIDFMSRF